MADGDIGIGIILAVHTEDGHIETLRVQGLFAQTPEDLPRSQIVTQIKAGTHLYPLYSEEGGATQLGIGPRVHIVEVDGVEYLRTAHDKIREDNLGEIDTF